MMSANPTYAAFISYSHADERAAARLHRALETYSIPGRLVGKTTQKGEVPKRLGRIFRDREELSAGSDLSQAVQEALHNSAALIVLCSPQAATSKWVNAEIALFRELHPDRDILVAILDGEPGAQDPARDCYPAALFPGGARSVEPLGADFRAEGDGPSMGRLKLIAGLLGLPLDQIIQRDLQRRNRRVMAVTVMSVLSAIVLGGLTLFAMSARSEAEQRKAEAEDLIEFMLNDLRDRLEPVGRLDVLDAVGAKVIEYYEDRSVARMTADSLGRRSRAFHLLGEIDAAQGNLDSAINHFRNAYITTQQILAVDPNEPARIYEHSQSAFWVGYFAYRRNDLDVAERRFVEYRDLAAQLVAADAENAEWRTEAAYAQSNLGSLYLGQRRFTDAQTAFQSALLEFEWLSDAQPESDVARNELADAWGWMASILEITEGADAAISATRAQLDVMSQMETSDTDWRIRRNALVAESGLARLLMVRGQTGAPADLEEALAIAETISLEADALVNHEPDNRNWRRVVIAQRLTLSRIYLVLGRLDEARTAYLDAMAYMAHPSWQAAEDVAADTIRLSATLMEASLFYAGGDMQSAEMALTALINELALTESWAGRIDGGPYFYAAATNLLADIRDVQGRALEAREMREIMVSHLTDVESELRANARFEFERAQARLEAELLSAE
ncbi:MAG: toll/interleukin-1 receptor domain-containing protein [Alphaproteobacteria bacterium]|nr:toll/interleukin-1 receptor domain-containing protein [Alphaproteobacteria bacterium]